jgi:NAD-dependent SIR2 family protein deacetylase
VDVELLELVAGGRVAILTGAGISTGSGIPDYRGPSSLARRSSGPITYQEFVAGAQARQRYWARSHIGWQALRHALPNDGHFAVADLQAGGLVAGVITQNVDGLHQAGGARDVIELHGSISKVICLSCGEVTERSELAERLGAVNPSWQRETFDLKPDGDADIEDVSGFHVVDCLACGGLLKPDVVFFGETVPAPRVARSFALVEEAKSLLVLGSSLKVMSGYRFVLHAKKLGIPIGIVNQGPTRGDAHADVLVDAELSSTLRSTALALG